MSLNSIFDIAGSGMNAHSVRLNTTASNLANAQSVAASPEEAYKAKMPVFRAVQLEASKAFEFQDEAQTLPGVQVSKVLNSEAEAQARYEPGHPLANEDGYVFYPNVNVVEEMSNMIAASRAFQVNVEVMNSAKTMAQRVLTLGQ